MTRTPDASVLALGPGIVVTCASTAGVALFERQPPAHTVLLGRARVEVEGLVRTESGMAVPANVAHRILELPEPVAGAVYLDPRRFRFEDVERLAQMWRGFEPGRDDVREAVGDAMRVPRCRVDARVLRALELMEAGDPSVPDVAACVGLSPSRLTHLMSETLGTPPRTWRTWFRLAHAIRHAAFGRSSLTEAAHVAGFADSAHLTRTCKRMLGVRPGGMLPQTVHGPPNSDER